MANSAGCLRVDRGGSTHSLRLEPAFRLLDVNRLVTVPSDRCHAEQAAQDSVRGERNSSGTCLGSEASTAEGLYERAWGRGRLKY